MHTARILLLYLLLSTSVIVDAQVSVSPARAIVVDSTSGSPKVLGEVASLIGGPDINPYPLVFMKLSGRLFAVWVYTADIKGTIGNNAPGSPLVQFESTDCSGRGWVQTTFSYGSMPQTFVVGARRSVYVRSGTATSRVTVLSALDAYTSACFAWPSTGDYYPAAKLVDLADVFTPPYRVVAQ